MFCTMFKFESKYMSNIYKSGKEVCFTLIYLATYLYESVETKKSPI